MSGLPSNLNYTILGLEEYEVFAFEIDYGSILVEYVLKHTCLKHATKLLGKPDQKGEFWLVRGTRL